MSKINRENSSSWDILKFNVGNSKITIELKKPLFKQEENITLQRMIESMIRFYERTILPARNSLVKVSIVKIKARNYAHNIGAHIDENTTPNKINTRVNDIYKIQVDFYNTTEDRIEIRKNQKIALEWIDNMKERLDNYRTTRNEYLADYRLPPKNLMFYRDVILPFVENTLIMDNIAKSEGICYDNSGECNRLKIKTYINGQELKAEYPNTQGLKYSNNNNNNIEYINEICYPDIFPYLLKKKMTKNLYLKL